MRPLRSRHLCRRRSALWLCTFFFPAKPLLSSPRAWLSRADFARGRCPAGSAWVRLGQPVDNPGGCPPPAPALSTLRPPACRAGLPRAVGSAALQPLFFFRDSRPSQSEDLVARFAVPVPFLRNGTQGETKSRKHERKLEQSKAPLWLLAGWTRPLLAAVGGASHGWRRVGALALF